MDADAGAVHDAVIDIVLDRYKGLAEPASCDGGGRPTRFGEVEFLAEVVRRSGISSWYVPVPLDDVPGGGAGTCWTPHNASSTPSSRRHQSGLIESLGRRLAPSRRLMIVIDDIDRMRPGPVVV